MLQISVLLILLNLVLCGITQAFGRPVLDVYPRSGFVKEGQTLRLQCGTKKGQVSWYKNGQHFAYTQNNVYAIRTTRETGGSYHCVVYNPQQMSGTVEVVITDRNVAFHVIPVSPLEGEILKLNCRHKYNYWREKDFTFHRNGKKIRLVKSTARESSYHFRVNSTNSSGLYNCEIDGSESQNVDVQVREAFAVPKFTVYPEGQLVDGQWFELKCLVEENLSEGSLLYGFYRNGIPLQSPSDHSEYISESARPADSGTYHCEVTGSEVRKHSNQLHLSIRGIPVSKPELIIQPRKKLIKGDAGFLICSVSNGSLPIYYQFYKGSSMKLYWELSNSTKLVYNIEAISSRDKGMYHCSVRNEVTGPLHSEDVEITVIVPVTDAVLISRTNGTEIQPGDRLVLRCLVTEGTEPQFIWYRDNVPLRNGSASSHVTADGGELVLHSFRRDNVGKYHCAAINEETNGTIFNVTSDCIEFTLRARSYSTEIAASLVLVLLFAGLIASAWFIHRRRDTGNSSTVSQPKRSRASGEGAAASNLEYAVTGAAHNAENTAADLVYSVVAIKKRADAGSSVGFSSNGKKDAKPDPDDYCVTYVTLKLSEPSEGEDRADGNIYENTLLN